MCVRACARARARYLPRVMIARRTATGQCVSTVGRLRCASCVLDGRVALGCVLHLVAHFLCGRDRLQKQLHGEREAMRSTPEDARAPATSRARPAPPPHTPSALTPRRSRGCRAGRKRTGAQKGAHGHEPKVAGQAPQDRPHPPPTPPGSAARKPGARGPRRVGKSSAAGKEDGAAGGRQRKIRRFSQILSLVRAGSPCNVQGGAREGKWGLWGEWLGRR